MKILTLYTLCIIALILQSCGDSTSPTSDDIQTIKIGTQVWTSKNLDISTYRNGDSIRYATTPAEWRDAAKKQEGVWCYYNYDPKQGELYGKLYSWYAVNDPRGLAPLGFHIPSDAEWSVLIDYLGGDQIAGFKMKSTAGWNNGGNGDNSSGFNGLAGGFNYYNGDCDDVGVGGNFGSSSTAPNNLALTRFLKHFDSKVGRGTTGWDWGLSVRCLKD